MIIRYRQKYEIASLRDAPDVLTISHRTALRLYGVIEIKPLRGFFGPLRIIIKIILNSRKSNRKSLFNINFILMVGSIYLFSCRVPIGTHLFASDNHRTTYGVIHISPRWGD